MWKKLLKNKITSDNSCQFLLLSKTNSISHLCQLLLTPLSSVSKPTSIFHSLPVLGCDHQLEMIVEQDTGTSKFCLSQRRTVICPCCRSKKLKLKTNQTKWVLFPCAAGLSFYQYSWASCLKCFWKWSVLHKHTWWTLSSRFMNWNSSKHEWDLKFLSQSGAWVHVQNEHAGYIIKATFRAKLLPELFWPRGGKKRLKSTLSLSSNSSQNVSSWGFCLHFKRWCLDSSTWRRLLQVIVWSRQMSTTQKWNIHHADVLHSFASQKLNRNK